LRIRNLFLSAPLPVSLERELRAGLGPFAAGTPAVVRSTAPGEDSGATSFAGIHESYVNVCGIDAILRHIRLVWASLWSDRALLYRRELGLDISGSRMAVLVQALVHGERSGVAFGRNPANRSQLVVESVHGLNQGLVDGTVEPDRWFVARDSGRIVAHHAVKRERAVVPTPAGTATAPLTPGRRQRRR